MAKAKKTAKKASKKVSKKVTKAPKVAKVPVVKVPKAPANPASKGGIIANCSIAAEISGKAGKAYYDALTEGAYANLKKNGTFVLPGFAKFTVKKKKKATPARKGVNPFTEE